MNNMALITYLRKNESITTELEDAVVELFKRKYINSVIVCADLCNKTSLNLPVPINITWLFDTGETKYSRLCQAINLNKELVLLSIDNDVSPNIDNIISLLDAFYRENTSIAWGKIGVSNKGILADIISIDKRLSHDMIRPLLWMINLGISVPGQCFIIRAKSFSNILPARDTFLDDLQIGILTAINKKSKLNSKLIVGNEIAKNSIVELLIQRKRWAEGYAAILKNQNGRSYKETCLILIHGFMYHFFFPMLLLALMSNMLSNIISVSLMIFMLFWLASFRVKHIINAIGYCVLFPCVHIYWLCHLLRLIISNK